MAHNPVFIYSEFHAATLELHSRNYNPDAA